MKNTGFINMVNDDIIKCEETINTKQNAVGLLNELIGKYSKVSKNFPDIEINQLMFKMHPDLPLDHVRAIQGFLKAYSLNNCEDYCFDDTKNSGINVITNITNTNENSVTVESFAEVKNKIENMSSLPDNEIEDILAKITELESISNSSDRKSKKWEKAKDIIKWVADKGVDVGIALLPLIMQIGQ